MFPTKHQWTKWSLPSKLTAVSAYLTIGTVLASVVLFLAGLAGDIKFQVSSDQSTSAKELTQLFARQGHSGAYVGSEMTCVPNDVCRDKIFTLPKVVLLSENAPLFHHPDASTYIDGITLKPFQRYFVLNTSLGPDNKRWVKIGSSIDDALGWARRVDTTSYGHRISFSTYSSLDRAIPIFLTSDELLNYMERVRLEEYPEKFGSIGSLPGEELADVILPILTHLETSSDNGNWIKILQTRLPQRLTSYLDINCGDCNYWIPDRFADGKKSRKSKCYLLETS